MESEKKKLKINIHIVFAVIVVICIVILANKFIGFGRVLTQEELDAIPVPENPEIEIYDDFKPNMADDDGTFPVDDEVTTVVLFGNSPFADDRASSISVVSLFTKETGVTVYNLAVAESYMTAANEPAQTDSYPMDAFNFSNLAKAFASGDTSLQEEAYEMMEDASDELQEVTELTASIDPRTIDAVIVMYDGADYLNSSMAWNDNVIDDPLYFTGAMAAGVKTIQEAYPWIRIIIMSPTYAYGIDENGNYVGSDLLRNDWELRLSDYFVKQAEIAYRLEVSFVDNFFGGFHEETAEEYLSDNIHLNLAGRKLVVLRMTEALERYTTIY